MSEAKPLEVKAADSSLSDAAKKRKRVAPVLDENNIIKAPNEVETRRTTRAIARGDTPVVPVKKAKVVKPKAPQNGEKRAAGRPKKQNSDKAEGKGTEKVANNTEKKEEANKNNNEDKAQDKKAAEDVNGEKDKNKAKAENAAEETK